LFDDASDSNQLELQKILNGNLFEQKHSGQICSITLIMFSAIQWHCHCDYQMRFLVYVLRQMCVILGHYMIF
jgi:hypothetical protein